MGLLRLYEDHLGITVIVWRSSGDYGDFVEIITETIEIEVLQR